MPRDAIQFGPTGDRVAARIAALRADRQLSYGALSARLLVLGRPIAPEALGLLEKVNHPRRRRIDVDDLVALALALECSPNALLLDPVADERELPITENRALPARVAWNWARAAEYAPAEVGRFSNYAPGVNSPISQWGADTMDRYRRWNRENRPDVPEPTPGDLAAAFTNHAETLAAVVAADVRVEQDGVSYAVADFQRERSRWGRQQRTQGTAGSAV